MKLSEEIRLGAVLGKQLFGLAFGPNESSCAFGAALIAHGGLVRLNENGVYERTSGLNVKDIWAWLKDSFPLCPECGQMQQLGGVVHLNDYHKWSRERIAEFVATIEPNEEETCSSVESVESPAVQEKKLVESR